MQCVFSTPYCVICVIQSDNFGFYTCIFRGRFRTLSQTTISYPLPPHAHACVNYINRKRTIKIWKIGGIYCSWKVKNSVLYPKPFRGLRWTGNRFRKLNKKCAHGKRMRCGAAPLKLIPLLPENLSPFKDSWVEKLSGQSYSPLTATLVTSSPTRKLLNP